ncbi:MAG: FliG C-terminal domain-containing protein [Bdellovibrionales bacterium]
MALLTRYKKSGGFLQLVMLIETCSEAKRNNLLEKIEQEDPRWAKAIRQKMLTLDRILQWPEETLADIFAKTKNLTMAVLFHDLNEEQRQRFLSGSTHRQKSMHMHFVEEQNPGKVELETAKINLVESVRELINEGYITLKTIAPELVFTKGIEEELSRQPRYTNEIEHAAVAKNLKAKPIGGESLNYSKNNRARKQPTHEDQLAFLSKELKKYKEENQNLKQKLKSLEDQLKNQNRAA